MNAAVLGQPFLNSHDSLIARGGAPLLRDDVAIALQAAALRARRPEALHRNAQLAALAAALALRPVDERVQAAEVEVEEQAVEPRREVVRPQRHEARVAVPEVGAGRGRRRLEPEPRDERREAVERRVARAFAAHRLRSRKARKKSAPRVRMIVAPGATLRW